MYKKTNSIFFNGYLFFFKIKCFHVPDEEKVKYLCKYISININKIQIYVFDLLQKKIMKFIIKKEFDVIKKLKNLGKEKTEKKRISLNKITLSIEKRINTHISGFQKKSFKPWNHPKTWSHESKDNIGEIDHEKPEKKSFENSSFNHLSIENFEVKASQKISKIRLKKKNVYITKLSNLKSKKIEDSIIFPYFNLCLDKIKTFLATKKPDNKNSLGRKIKNKTRILLFDESADLSEPNKNFFFNFSSSLYKLQDKNLQKKHFQLFANLFFCFEKKNIYFFSNLSPILEKTRKIKNTNLVIKILDFLKGIGRNWFCIQQLNPQGEVLCFFLKKK